MSTASCYISSIFAADEEDNDDVVVVAYCKDEQVGKRWYKAEVSSELP